MDSLPAFGAGDGAPDPAKVQSVTAILGAFEVGWDIETTLPISLVGAPCFRQNLQIFSPI